MVFALSGESTLEKAGLGGSLRLGNLAAIFGGADIGAEVGSGVRGKADADTDTDTVLRVGLQLGVAVGSGVRGKLDADVGGVCLLLDIEA